jgi:hypothetical protein
MEERYTDRAVIMLGQLEEGPRPSMTEVRTERTVALHGALSAALSAAYGRQA